MREAEEAAKLIKEVAARARRALHEVVIGEGAFAESQWLEGVELSAEGLAEALAEAVYLYLKPRRGAVSVEKAIATADGVAIIYAVDGRRSLLWLEELVSYFEALSARAREAAAAAALQLRGLAERLKGIASSLP